MRVQITKLPLDKAAFGKQVQGGLDVSPTTMGGADYTASDKTFYKGVKDTLSAVPRSKANLEAEGGETAFGPISGQSIPDHMKILGKRHHQGGVPLNLPDDTFIFSDTAELKIKEPSVLAMFNKAPKKGGYTPAELAKPYNINKYKTILLDPDTSKLERDTAIIMIKNYIMKLGALALVQESMKGFPQGIPEMAKPYMEANGISEEDLMPELKAQADALAQQQPGNAPEMPQEQNPMAAQEMQQMAPEQSMEADQAMINQSQQGYPQQMPSGAPVASPESIDQMEGAMPPPEMMQQQGMMAYGGMPYAEYGMQMGGYDFPYYPDQMTYGGVPRFDPGGPTGNGVTVNNIPATITTTAPTGWNTGTVVGAGPNAQGWYQQGEERKSANKAVTGSGTFNRSEWEDAICTMIQNGATYEELTDPEIAFQKTGSRKTHMAPGAASKAIFDRCNTQEVQEKFTEKAVYLENEDPNKTSCLCLNSDGSVFKDADGNTKIAPTDTDGNCLPNDPSCTDGSYEVFSCKCVDPNTGEVTEFSVEREEDCVCEGGESGEMGSYTGANFSDQPHWSIPAQTNVLRNQLMATEPAPGNVVLPGSTQAKGAYEEYQTKTDQALAAVQSGTNAIMAGTSGSTGRKQGRIKDIIGKGLRAAMDAVAAVQSRNVDRQRETNVQDATISNTNELARNSVMNQGLEGQENRGNVRITNRNKKRFNTFGAVMDADKDMALRQQMNVTTPQYASEYDYGFVYPTGIEKPLTGATGATLDELTEKHIRKGVPYEKAYQLALREMKTKYGGQKMGNGGYVWVDNIYPFQ